MLLICSLAIPVTIWWAIVRVKREGEEKRQKERKVLMETAVRTAEEKNRKEWY